MKNPVENSERQPPAKRTTSATEKLFSPPIEDIIRREKAWREVGGDREVYEAIYGAPGDYPAMEF